MTHMICESCEAGNVISDEWILCQKRKVAAYYGDLRALLREHRFSEAAMRLDQARGLGIRAQDLVIGLIAPLYHFLTETWHVGSWSPEWESPVVAQVAQLLDHLVGKSPEILRYCEIEKPQILLLVESHNRPQSGLRIVELGLASQAITNKVIALGETTAAMMAQLAQHRPKTVTFVVSSKPRFSQIESLVGKLGANRSKLKPTVLVATPPQCVDLHDRARRGLLPCREPLDILRQAAALIPKRTDPSGIYRVTERSVERRRVGPAVD